MTGLDKCQKSYYNKPKGELEYFKNTNINLLVTLEETSEDHKSSY